MISNNTTYKLRASKSSRDVHDYDYTNSDENFESSLDDDLDDTNRRNPPYLKESRYGKGVGRSRSTEFRSSRSNERRTYRGRGSGAASRRGDRDYSDNFYNLRKYESRNSDLGWYIWNSINKLYCPVGIMYKYVLKSKVATKIFGINLDS